MALALWLLSMGVGQAAGAEKPGAHGLAMHGDLKYPDGFSTFAYVNPDAPKGGTVRHAAAGSFDSLNPFIVKGRPPPGLQPQVFQALLSRAWDEPFSLYGLIAERVEVPEDRSWVLFHLHPDARWHDGYPITPADVLFTWNILRQQGRPNHRFYYNRVQQAEAVGERGVRFHFTPLPASALVAAPAPAPAPAPDSAADPVPLRYDRELPLILGLMPVLPEHYWRTRDFTATTLEPPLGSGPYRIIEIDPGRAITYTRVADYWGQSLPVNRGQHNFDRIRYEFYRDDGMALEAFKAGLVDVRRESDPARWFTAYDVPAQTEGRFRREAVPHGRPEPLRAFVFNTRRPIFRDPAVRAALSLAFDAAWINRHYFHGAYRRSTSYFANSELAAPALPSAGELALLEPFRALLPPALFAQPFTLPETDGASAAGLRPLLRQAAAQLSAAGWVVRDGRRVEAQHGRRLEFEILLNQPADERLALEFARALERIGVLVRVRTVDSAQYQERLDSFDYDMILHRWGNSLSPGNEQAVYFGAAAARQRGSRNYAGVNSPVVDAVIAALTAAADRPALVAAAHALDRVLLWGHYTIPLFTLGEDWLALAAPIRHPATVPVYGTVFESWWWEAQAAVE